MSASLMQIDEPKKSLPKKIKIIGWGLTLVGIVAIAAAYIIDSKHTAFNNVIGFLYLTSIALGAMFFIAIEYVSGAVWSVPIRRVFEFLLGTLTILPFIAVPVLFNLDNVFHWIHPDPSDELIAHKVPYLNLTFFLWRFVGVLVIWNIFAWFFTRNSLRQDLSGDQKLTRANIRLSAIFLPVLAITLTITAIDWAMSLEPHWYSTVFGVYYFSGTVLSAISVATYIIIKLNEGNYIQNLKRDHFYSLGALLFAFINFWAYIAFSQFLLIWYANLPEETSWFISRWQGGMEFVSIFLIVVHFVVPYFVLLSQDAKMDTKKLKFISIWILLAHYIDLYWLVMPSYKSGITFTLIEFIFPIFIVGIIILVIDWKIKRYNILPVGDPKLERGINFRL